jgi:hypothetical protein
MHSLLVENIVHSLFILFRWFIFLFFIAQVTVHYVANHIFSFVFNLLMKLLRNQLILVILSNSCKFFVPKLSLCSLYSCSVHDDFRYLLVVKITSLHEVVFVLDRFVVYLPFQVGSLLRLNSLFFLTHFVIGNCVHFWVLQIQMVIVKEHLASFFVVDLILDLSYKFI